jgi:hypothetical protein
MTPRERLTPKEIQIAILVWEGLTNRKVGRIVGPANRSSRITCEVSSTNSVLWSAWNSQGMCLATAARTGLALRAPLSPTPSQPINAGLVCVCGKSLPTRKQHCKTFHEMRTHGPLIAS